MKKNIKITIYILLAIIIFILGYYIGYTRNPASLITDDGCLYFTGNIGAKNPQDFDHIMQVSQTIKVQGVVLKGKITTISLTDVKKIKEIVLKIENVDPIISIEVINSKTIKVTTEKIMKNPGLFNGGGKVYYLEKKEGRWILNKDLHGIWVS
jgi:hypothetical protein